MASELVPVQNADALQFKHYLENSTVQTRWGVRTVNITGFQEPVYLDDLAKRMIELSKMILHFHVRDRVFARQALDKIRTHYQTSDARQNLPCNQEFRKQIESQQIERRLRGFTKEQLKISFPRNFWLRFFLEKYHDPEWQQTLYLIPQEDLIGNLRRQSTASK